MACAFCETSCAVDASSPIFAAYALWNFCASALSAKPLDSHSSTTSATSQIEPVSLSLQGCEAVMITRSESYPATCAFSPVFLTSALGGSHSHLDSSMAEGCFFSSAE